MQKAAELLRRIETNAATAADRGAVLTALLREFFRGYPVVHIRSLLESNDTETVKAGIWLASELGTKAKPILDDIAPLLQNQTSYVRFFSLDCILVCAGPDHRHLIASALALLGDSEGSVRWKATDFLARASDEQLSSALEHLTGEPGSQAPLVKGLRWFVSSEAKDPLSIEEMLNDSSPFSRKFGFAAALRLSRSNDMPLRAAAKSEDADLRVEANRELESLQRLSPSARSRER